MGCGGKPTPRVPFVDFCVWGPCSSRTARLRRYNESVMMPDGSWQNKLLYGPSSFYEWRQSWRIFRTAMIALNLATPYALDEYEEGIELLHTRFPNRWGAIWALDEEVRSRGWKDVREKIINRSHVPSTPEWDPKHPW